MISKKWFSKLQFKSLKLKKSLFALYYEDTCKITKDNLIAFMKSNSNYEVKNTLSHTKAKTLILVGNKERPIVKKSATLCWKSKEVSSLNYNMKKRRTIEYSSLFYIHCFNEKYNFEDDYEKIAEDETTQVLNECIKKYFEINKKENANEWFICYTIISNLYDLEDKNYYYIIKYSYIDNLETEFILERLNFVLIFFIFL